MHPTRYRELNHKSSKKVAGVSANSRAPSIGLYGALVLIPAFETDKSSLGLGIDRPQQAKRPTTPTQIPNDLDCQNAENRHINPSTTIQRSQTLSATAVPIQSSASSNDVHRKFSTCFGSTMQTVASFYQKAQGPAWYIRKHRRLGQLNISHHTPCHSRRFGNVSLALTDVHSCSSIHDFRVGHDELTDVQLCLEIDPAKMSQPLPSLAILRSYSRRSFAKTSDRTIANPYSALGTYRSAFFMHKALLSATERSILRRYPVSAYNGQSCFSSLECIFGYSLQTVRRRKKSRWQLAALTYSHITMIEPLIPGILQSIMNEKNLQRMQQDDLLEGLCDPYVSFDVSQPFSDFRHVQYAESCETHSITRHHIKQIYSMN
uniref:Protease n=1 Tax=Geomicrobium sp. EMB2 TaxID=767635 RepID=D7RJV5_9BACL|nr:protease [Geomicrobium sp. EMB2]